MPDTYHYHRIRQCQVDFCASLLLTHLPQLDFDSAPIQDRRLILREEIHKNLILVNRPRWGVTGRTTLLCVRHIVAHVARMEGRRLIVLGAILSSMLLTIRSLFF